MGMRNRVYFDTGLNKEESGGVGSGIMYCKRPCGMRDVGKQDGEAGNGERRAGNRAR